MTITAKTIDAGPRGPNHPTKPSVGGRACEPHIRDHDRHHPHERQAQERVESDLPGERSHRGAEQDRPEEHERHPLSTDPSSSVSRLSPSGSRPSAARNTIPATNAAMNPDPWSPLAIPYARRTRPRGSPAAKGRRSGRAGRP